MSLSRKLATLRSGVHMSLSVYWSWFDFSYDQILGERHHNDPSTLKEEEYRAVRAHVPNF